MHAATQHDALIYAMYPTAIPQPTRTATLLDNRHSATLTAPTAHRLRRALATALTALRDTPIA